MIDVFNIEIGHRPLALSAGLKTLHRPSRASALVRVATDSVGSCHIHTPLAAPDSAKTRSSLAKKFGMGRKVRRRRLGGHRNDHRATVRAGSLSTRLHAINPADREAAGNHELEAQAVELDGE